MHILLKKVLFISTLATFMFLIVGCAATASEPTQAVGEEATTSDPVAAIDPTATAEPVVAATALPTEDPDYCLDCHSDKETLVAMAKPEEKVESESKGVG